jgi:hypothetical protein
MTRKAAWERCRALEDQYAVHDTSCGIEVSTVVVWATGLSGKSFAVGRKPERDNDVTLGLGDSRRASGAGGVWFDPALPPEKARCD